MSGFSISTNILLFIASISIFALKEQFIPLRTSYVDFNLSLVFLLDLLIFTVSLVPLLTVVTYLAISDFVIKKYFDDGFSGVIFSLLVFIILSCLYWTGLNFKVFETLPPALKEIKYIGLAFTFVFAIWLTFSFLESTSSKDFSIKNFSIFTIVVINVIILWIDYGTTISNKSQMLVDALSFSIVATFGILGAQKYVLYRTKPKEPIKPEKINEIVNAFILTVKDKIVDKPLVYFDEKTLPFPKKDIENALFLAMHICKNANDDEQYNNLKVALVTMLPYFQKGVGKIPIPEFPEIEGMLENPNELIDVETIELVKKFDKINSNVNRKKIDALKKANLKDQMNFHDKLYLQKLEDRVWRFN